MQWKGDLPGLDPLSYPGMSLDCLLLLVLATGACRGQDCVGISGALGQNGTRACDHQPNRPPSMHAPIAAPCLSSSFANCGFSWRLFSAAAWRRGSTWARGLPPCGGDMVCVNTSEPSQWCVNLSSISPTGQSVYHRVYHMWGQSKLLLSKCDHHRNLYPDPPPPPPTALLLTAGHRGWPWTGPRGLRGSGSSPPTLASASPGSATSRSR